MPQRRSRVKSSKYKTRGVMFVDTEVWLLFACIQWREAGLLKTDPEHDIVSKYSHRHTHTQIHTDMHTYLLRATSRPARVNRHLLVCTGIGGQHMQLMHCNNAINEMK